MELTELSTLTPTDLISQIKSEKQKTDIKRSLDQMDVMQHPIVVDKGKYPDKIVTTDKGTDIVKIARLPLDIQNLIVLYAATFLCGNPIEVDGQPETSEVNMLNMVYKVLKDNKVNFYDLQLAKKLFSETEVAELWYVKELGQDDPYWKDTPIAGTPFKLRYRVLANSLGDTLYPVFDQTGDMIAFGRGYAVKVNGNNVNHFDLYTDTQFRYFEEGNNGFVETETITNTIGKIPVIYWQQDKTEWANVQPLIERLEALQSKHADNNDYFGDPILVLEGNVKGWADKGEAGKTVQMNSTPNNKAAASFLTWDSAPESKKMEMENLRYYINYLTQTPDISIDTLQGMGNFSGIALKMLFLNAHMKAADHATNFGEGVQRRYNFIMKALSVFNSKLQSGLTLDIQPKFNYFLPKDDTEIINNLSTAVAGGFMSKETATEQNPFIENSDTEKDRLKEENATSFSDVLEE